MLAVMTLLEYPCLKKKYRKNWIDVVEGGLFSNTEYAEEPSMPIIGRCCGCYGIWIWVGGRRKKRDEVVTNAFSTIPYQYCTTNKSFVSLDHECLVLCRMNRWIYGLERAYIPAIEKSRLMTVCHQPLGTKTHSPASWIYSNIPSSLRCFSDIEGR